MKDRREFFDSMASVWDSFSGEEDSLLRRVTENSDIAPGQRILDVGTGTGILLPFIYEKAGPESEIFALDYSAEMIRCLHGKNLPENVTALLMDIHGTCFKNDFFNRIIANSCYPHFDDRSKALGEIYRILAKEGLFIISHPAGRERVNEVHKGAHRLLEADIVPEPALLEAEVSLAGFNLEKAIDEPCFFMMAFSKKAGTDF